MAQDKVFKSGDVFKDYLGVAEVVPSVAPTRKQYDEVGGTAINVVDALEALHVGRGGVGPGFKSPRQNFEDKALVGGNVSYANIYKKLADRRRIEDEGRKNAKEWAAKAKAEPWRAEVEKSRRVRNARVVAARQEKRDSSRTGRKA